MSDPSRRIPLPHHGGDLTFATRIYGTPSGGWVDLSTGINPEPYPVPPIPTDALHRLPEKEALLGLLDAARAAYRVPPGIDLIAVPGTEVAIRLLPLLAPTDGVAIVSPTYGSYGAAWPKAVEVPSIADLPDDTVTAVVANPNNPDGRITNRDALVRLGARLPRLIVDEAFADLEPEASIIPAMTNASAVVVLRSLGKFYGLAGLRLGFVAARPVAAYRIAAFFGDWPVSGPALIVGAAALADTAWREVTRSRLREAMGKLRDLLSRHDLAVTGGTDLFALVDVDNAHALHRALAERGIWTRAFVDQPRWLRFGLPGADGMERLAAALSAAR